MHVSSEGAIGEEQDADDEGAIRAYLTKLRDATAYITDSLSGEKLDILTQCVNISISGTSEFEAYDR